MKNIFTCIALALLVVSLSEAELTDEQKTKKYSRNGFLDPKLDEAGAFYSIEIGFEDTLHEKVIYLVNSIEVTEQQLYELLSESYRRNPKVEARGMVFPNLTIEQMIVHVRGLVDPQAPSKFPKVRVFLKAAENESIYHVREVGFRLSPRQQKEIQELRAEGFKFPYRIGQTK